ncbi:hypothetical protein BV911_05265 [Pseudoruegeria sp. SK021]|nr:hypothetical protein BV911_05265 [Pseudoruegeria sp. SK021]
MSRTVLLMLLAMLPACEQATPPPETSATQEIPAALQGRWGLVPADCTSTRGDAKGLMLVSATTLTFYESRAEMAQVYARSDHHLEADFDFLGEGIAWTYRESLDLQNAGQTLERQETGGDAAAVSLRYQQCP